MSGKVIQEATELLQKDLWKTLNYLVEKLDQNKDLYKQVALIYGRLSDLKEQSVTGDLSHEEQRTTRNQIRESLLNIIQNIEDSDLSRHHTGIFITHAPEDANLALALKDFILKASGGRIKVLCNEDLKRRLSWEDYERAAVKTAIVKSEKLFVIITPGANERPWLFEESGFAAGKEKEIICTTYFIDKKHVHPAFAIDKRLHFNCEDEAGINQLLKHLTKEDPEFQKDEDITEFLLSKYTKQVQDEKEISFSKILFLNHFHQRELAAKMAGKWYAKWTQVREDGNEDVFETDRLHVWSSENRIRVIGFNSKININKIKAENAAYYPMEGVVSWRGWVAFSYWSAGNIPICGTCLIEPTDGAGEVFEGRWQGFTSRDIKAKPEYIHGRVIWARNEDDIAAYLD